MMNSKNKSLLAPLILIIIGLVLILVFVFVKFVQPPADQQNNIDSTENLTPPNLSRISQNEAKLAHDQNLAVLLDVRDTASFESSHISNSINIPLQFLETRMAELDKAQWIITVCA